MNTRTATIQISKDYNGQKFFVYANGTPGDIEIETRVGELESWFEIVDKVNAHEELVKALEGLFNEYLRARERINELAPGSVSQEDAKDAVKIKRAVRELLTNAGKGE